MQTDRHAAREGVKKAKLRSAKGMATRGRTPFAALRVHGSALSRALLALQVALRAKLLCAIDALAGGPRPRPPRLGAHRQHGHRVRSRGANRGEPRSALRRSDDGGLSTRSSSHAQGRREGGHRPCHADRHGKRGVGGDCAPAAVPYPRHRGRGVDGGAGASEP